MKLNATTLLRIAKLIYLYQQQEKHVTSRPGATAHLYQCITLQCLWNRQMKQQSPTTLNAYATEIKMASQLIERLYRNARTLHNSNRTAARMHQHNNIAEQTSSKVAPPSLSVYKEKRRRKFTPTLDTVIEQSERRSLISKLCCI